MWNKIVAGLDKIGETHFQGKVYNTNQKEL